MMKVCSAKSKSMPEQTEIELAPFGFMWYNLKLTALFSASIKQRRTL